MRKLFIEATTALTQTCW